MAQPRKLQTIAATSSEQRLDTERFAPANRKRLSAPALRSFLAISDLWGLSEERRRLILGYPSRSTYHHWMRLARTHEAVTLDVDCLMRLSGIFGIHQALGILFSSEAEAVGWLKGSHAAPLFGQRPLDLVTSGSQDGILAVRRFLDAARGGLYSTPNGLDIDFVPYTDADIVIS